MKLLYCTEFNTQLCDDLEGVNGGMGSRFKREETFLLIFRDISFRSLALVTF